jgi:hypothetical protein
VDGLSKALARRDTIGLALVAASIAGMIAYRAAYIEPRAWGAVCAAAAPPLACAPRAALLWLQQKYLWGAIALALGLWAFLWRGPFAVAVAAIMVGVAAVENYNATWGMVGLALGAWRWGEGRSVGREGWGESASPPSPPVIGQAAPRRPSTPSGDEGTGGTARAPQP